MNAPAWTRVWRDQKTGRVYCRFRHPHGADVALPTPVWSSDFMAAYEAALTAATDRQHAATTTIGADLARPGSLRAAVTAFHATDWADGLGAETARKRRKTLEAFCERNGDKLIANLRADQLQHLFDQLSAYNQRNWKKALLPFFKWCRRKKLISTLPTDGLELRRLPKRKAPTWSEEHVVQYQTAHAIGTPQRLLIEIALNCGPRGPSDLRLFSRANISRDVATLSFVAAKNKRRVTVPILPGLAACLAALPAGELQFFTTQAGTPMGLATFNRFVTKALKAAGLDGLGLQVHGLRRLCACRLALAGCSTAEIAAVIGDSEAMVKIYIADVDQERLAAQAIGKLAETAS